MGCEWTVGRAITCPVLYRIYFRCLALSKLGSPQLKLIPVHLALGLDCFKHHHFSSAISRINATSQCNATTLQARYTLYTISSFVQLSYFHTPKPNHNRSRLLPTELPGCNLQGPPLLPRQTTYLLTVSLQPNPEPASPTVTPASCLKKLPENLGPRSDACHVIHRQAECH